MCRFVLYVGPPILLSALVTEPEHSIIRQSFESRERSEPLNGDGFGLAWYVPEISAEAAQFRSITPAWSDENLRHLARMTRSSCVLAHVRAASPGLAVTQTNTHPFVWRQYAFMHNGEVAGFPRVKRALLDGLDDEAYGLIEGTTDSEHLFAVFVERLPLQEHGDQAERMAAALTGAIREVLDLCAQAGVEDPCTFNVAVADGQHAVACSVTDGPEDGAPSLYLHTGKVYACEDGVCRMLEPGNGGHAVLIASEPLSLDPGWAPVPANHLVVVGPGRTAELRPF